MTGEHGRASYLVEGGDGKVYRYSRDKVEIARVAKLLAVDTAPTETYAYSHIFGKADLCDIPCEKALTDLGEAMRLQPGTDQDHVCTPSNRCIPAGYTYLGQLIVHDITYLGVDMANNGRSPALDLDSVLPEKDPTKYMSGDPTPGLLAIGNTSDGPPFPQDIPRRKEGSKGEPIIADPRNDNFLPLSQCHLLLLKFYNAIAHWLGIGMLPYGAPENARAIREIWVKHFQAAVLDDYLLRIVGTTTHQNVKNGRRVIVHPGDFFTPDRQPIDAGDVNWLPLEFAAALGRYGHSMIRNSYPFWNRLRGGVTMDDFIRLSYRNSGDFLFEQGYAIKRDWPIDWLELLDFSGTGLRHSAHAPIMANLIDTRLAEPLGRLPSRILESPSSPADAFNLAALTLLRGRWCHLTSAQRALKTLNGALALKNAIPPLTRDEICDVSRDPKVEAFKAHPELFDETPLWFYMLREAEVKAGGRHLGPFGGRVVMETFHAAIAASEISILDGNGWTPTLPRAELDRFTFADLVAFAGNPDPLGGPITHI